jgi:hypothetical protein
LYAGDQILTSNSDDDFRTGLYTSHNTTKQYGMKTSPPKSKVVAFKGEVPIRSRTVINNMVRTSKYIHIFGI